jgi:ubiquinone biosynthesis protein Coq4
MLTALKKIRCAILIALTHHVALPLLKQVRKVNPFPYTRDQLQQMHEGTVGRDLAGFLGDKKLALLPHYARHDMKHVILGYDTTEEGELCLQSFMLGNGRVSFPVLATVLFGICTAPEFWKKMYAAHRLGRHCICIHSWNWFELVPENTLAIRNKIFSSNKNTTL